MRLSKTVCVLLVVVALHAGGCAKKTETGQKDLWDGRVIEDFEFIECRGRTVRRDDLLGKPWLCAFVFTRCQGTCPLLMARMEELYNEFKDSDVRFVCISVDPLHDTPEVLQSKWASKVGADPDKWWFLTTDNQPMLYRLIHNSFRLPVQEMEGPDRKPGFEVIHSENIVYVDAQGRIQGKFYALNPKSYDELRRFLRTPPVVRHFPLVNASLNSLATLLLLLGWVQIRSKQARAHKRSMIAAFCVSIAFLGCYLTYHYFAGSKPFDGEGTARTAYLTLLGSHIVLAALVPVLAIATIWLGLRAERNGNWPLHRRWAWVTFPIWLYVSITGVIIYVVLYHPDLVESLISKRPAGA